MSAIISKIQKGYHRSKGKTNIGQHKDLIEETPYSMRRRLRRRTVLDIDKKLEIAERVIIHGEL